MDKKFEALHERQKAVCRIMLGQRLMGTGILIKEDQVLTAWHVVRDQIKSPAEAAITFDFNLLPGVAPILSITQSVDPIVFCNPELDYCVIRLAKKITSITPISLGAASPEEGKTVGFYMLGFPAMLSGKPESYVATLEQIEHRDRRKEIESHFKYSLRYANTAGMSGAPVFLFNEDAPLVGMHVEGEVRDGKQIAGVALSIQSVRHGIEEETNDAAREEERKVFIDLIDSFASFLKAVSRHNHPTLIKVVEEILNPLADDAKGWSTGMVKSKNYSKTLTRLYADAKKSVKCSTVAEYLEFWNKESGDRILDRYQDEHGPKVERYFLFKSDALSSGEKQILRKHFDAEEKSGGRLTNYVCFEMPDEFYKDFAIVDSGRAFAITTSYTPLAAEWYFPDISIEPNKLEEASEHMKTASDPNFVTFQGLVQCVKRYERDASRLRSFFR